MHSIRRALGAALPPVLLLALLAPAGEAGDLTVFVAQASPSENWNTGFGATLGAGVLGLVALEGEAARFSAEVDSADMTTFSGSVMLAPAFGPIVPFAGFGIGVYRQSFGESSVTDVVRSFAAGLKVNVGRIFVIRGEYRSLDLGGNPLVAIDNRFSVGAGLQF